MALLSADEVAEQRRLLQAHRRTLAIYLRQAAELGGTTYSPPGLLNGVDEARRNIVRIKGVLRGAGVDIDDDPDDQAADEWATAPRLRSIATPILARPPTLHPLRWMALAVAGLASVTTLVMLAPVGAGLGFGLPMSATPRPTA